jgi:ferredoxin
MPEVTVDRTLCIGSGVCVVYAPASFEHDAEAKAVALDPPGDDTEALRVAVEGCPTGALRLTESA